jgi:membrane protease YdiL (CAAX protease family)
MGMGEYAGLRRKGVSVGQPSDEGAAREPLEHPAVTQPDRGRQQDIPSTLSQASHPEAIRRSRLRPRYWEAQLELARRGSLAWGFAAFFLGYGGYYLVGMIVSGALPRGPGFDPTQPPNLGPLLLLAFAPNILLGLVPAVFSWCKGGGLRSDYGILPTKRDVKIGLICGGLALFVSWLLGLVLVSISGQLPDDRISQLTHGPKSIWLLLFVLFAALGAPVTEELLMRGALWGALEYHRVPRGAILLLTSLIFAFIHEEMWRLPILFAGGIAIGAARMITGRIGASMIAHATNNFLPALVLFVAAH